MEAVRAADPPRAAAFRSLRKIAICSVSLRPLVRLKPSRLSTTLTSSAYLSAISVRLFGRDDRYQRPFPVEQLVKAVAVTDRGDRPAHGMDQARLLVVEEHRLDTGPLHAGRKLLADSPGHPVRFGRGNQPAAGNQEEDTPGHDQTVHGAPW